MRLVGRILKGLFHSAQGWTAAGQGGRSYPGERPETTPSTLKGLHPLPFSQIKDVRDYIAGQEAHHRKASFQDEFRALLRRYEIAFDERYVWD